MLSVLIASRNSYRVRATLASPAAAQARNNPSDTRFVCRATLAALVRGLGTALATKIALNPRTEDLRHDY